MLSASKPEPVPAVASAASSGRRLRISLSFARTCLGSSTTITTFSRTSWRRSWIAGTAQAGRTDHFAKWKRIPGLKLDHPRQLALMHSLVLFSHIAAQSTFTTSEIYADTVAAREVSKQDDRLASLRYDLSKLRAKVLVERVPRSRRYRLLRGGYTPSAWYS